MLNFNKILIKNLLRGARRRGIGREKGTYGALALILSLIR